MQRPIRPDSQEVVLRGGEDAILGDAVTRFFHATIAPDAGGTRIVSMRSEASMVNFGQIALGHWALRQGVDYVITLTNRSGAAAAANFIATFYE